MSEKLNEKTIRLLGEVLPDNPEEDTPIQKNIRKIMEYLKAKN